MSDARWRVNGLNEICDLAARQLGGKVSSVECRTFAGRMEVQLFVSFPREADKPQQDTVEARCAPGGPFDLRGVPYADGIGWRGRIERLEAFMLTAAANGVGNFANARQVLSLHVADDVRPALEGRVTWSG